MDNILLTTDSYKVSHHRMLPEGTTRMVANWTPRSLKHAPEGITKIVSFGQQAVIRWLNKEFHKFFEGENAVQQVKIELEQHLGMDYDVSHFQKLHDLQYLPLCFMSLKEGVEVPPGVPMMVWYNTHDDFAWLPLYLETVISNMLWKPMTSATIALAYRRNVNEFVNKTDRESQLTDFMVHDFSSRGMGSVQTSKFSGMGFLTASMGTDNLVAIQGIREFYGDTGPIAFSVPAAEHSVSSACIGIMGEKKMIEYYLAQYPQGIISIVSDTLDLTKLIKPIAGGYVYDLKETILSRDGRTVFRPDSSPPGLTPVDIICGHDNELSDRELEADYPEFYRKGLVQCLWEIFGGTTNEQGYKILDSHVGGIYGEGINLSNQREMYERLEVDGFAASNIVLGIGSYALNMNSRDTFGFAAKCTHCTINRKSIDIYKDPMTDGGDKKSAKGLIVVEKGGDYFYRDQASERDFKEQKHLQTIYEDGTFYNQTTLTEVRDKVNSLL